MAGESLSVPEKNDPLLKVRQFVTEIVHHPLLTEETRARRRLFPKKVISYLSDNGVDVGRCGIVPWGDYVWASTPESDYDMAIITEDSGTAQYVWDI